MNHGEKYTSTPLIGTKYLRIKRERIFAGMNSASLAGEVVSNATLPMLLL